MGPFYVIEIRVWPFSVVEVDPLADDAPGLEAVGKVVRIDSLVFEGALQPLDEDVVHAPAPAVHRDLDTGRPQALGEGEAGDLVALIGIEDLRLAVASQRLLEVLDAKAGEVEREIRRPAGFCQEQTLVLTEQLSSRERDAFHVSYLSDKIQEAVFHGQAVKTVAYLRVSTAQPDVRSQRLAILEYARKHDFRIDDFIEATA